MDPKEHEYMHQHGIEHTHAHEADPHHHHEHHHDHACEGHEGCGHDCASCGEIDPKAELIALMRYMIGHNTAHAQELVQLAEKLRGMNDAVACEQVLSAVADFEKGNMRLSTVLAALEG